MLTAGTFQASLPSGKCCLCTRQGFTIQRSAGKKEKETNLQYRCKQIFASNRVPYFPNVLETYVFQSCYFGHARAYYESWVVPAGVPSALADILGAELGPIIDFVKAKGGGLCDKINS